MKTLVATFILCCFCHAVDLNKHALIIGLNDHDLQYGNQDAIEFRNLLLNSLGFSSHQVELLVEQDATREKILTAISRISKDVYHDLDNEVVPMVYIYFSGHSIIDDAGISYFQTYGWSSEVPSTGIRSDEFVNEVTRQIPTANIIWFLDTCYAAASQNGGQGGRAKSITTLPPKIDEILLRYLKKSNGHQMGFLSSQANEKSWESDSLKHSLFTYYLIRGLRGEADQRPTGNTDGQVTAGELKHYLDRMVPIAAERLGHIQHPTVTPIFDSEIPLSVYVSLERFRIYSEKIPENVLDEIEQRSHAGERIATISFSNDGSWALVAGEDGDDLAGSGSFITALEEYRREHGETGYRSLSLYGSGGVAVFNSDDYIYRGIPQIVVDALEDKQYSNLDKRNILMLDDNTFLILSGENRWRGRGCPARLLDNLNKMYALHSTIRHVAIDSDGSWVVIGNNPKLMSDHSKGLVPEKMEQALSWLEDRQKQIIAIAFDPATHGWIIIAER